MKAAQQKTFRIDCPYCQARVAAEEFGRAERDISMDDPLQQHLIVGRCSACGNVLAGEKNELDIDCDSDVTPWSEIVRVYPEPLKDLQGWQIPFSVKVSLQEAEKCLQIGANIAACAMLGRALEAVCRDRLGKDVMLEKGIPELKDRKIIDDRLYDWSEQIRIFRNDTVHPDKYVSSVSSEDAKDLQSFVYAIIEYVYILTARYEEFLERKERKKSRILARNPTSH